MGKINRLKTVPAATTAVSADITGFIPAKVITA
jgi:hypothetical protein